MTSAVVHRATVDDGPALAALRREWAEENHGGPVVDDTYEGRFEEWYAAEQRSRVAWLAVVDGATVGMLNVLLFDRMPFPRTAETDRPTRWGYVANVYVLPAHRGAGLGAALLTALTSYADEHRLARLVLAPSERSIPLYERFGFAPAVDLMLRPGPR